MLDDLKLRNGYINTYIFLIFNNLKEIALKMIILSNSARQVFVKNNCKWKF